MFSSCCEHLILRSRAQETQNSPSIQGQTPVSAYLLWRYPMPLVLLIIPCTHVVLFIQGPLGAALTLSSTALSPLDYVIVQSTSSRENKLTFMEQIWAEGRNTVAT